MSYNFRNEGTIELNTRLKKIQIWSRGKQSSGIQLISDKIKSKGGFKILKIWEIVAAATIGDYLVNTELWTISSLSNRLFDNKINMLNFSRCLGFPNAKYMYF